MLHYLAQKKRLYAAVADLTIDAVKDIEGMPIHPGALKYYQEQGVL